MSKKNKKYIALSIMFLFLILVCVLVPGVVGRNALRKKKSDPILVNTKNRGIKISSELPVSDQFGKTISESAKSYVYYKFKVTNNSSLNRRYQVLIKKKDLDANEISGKYIKYYLTDASDDKPVSGFEDNLVPSYKKLNALKDSPAYKLLYSDKLGPYKTKEYILRVWVAEGYVNTESTDIFSFDIDARSF